MVKYVCQRCGYSTELKSHLVQHLSRKSECSPTLSNTPAKDLLQELNKPKSKRYHCSFCEKTYAHRSTKSTHQSTCKVKIPDKVIAELKILNDELLHVNETKNLEIRKLQQQVDILSLRKKESLFQSILEDHLKGCHRKVKSGITDVTTDCFHAELKEWCSWKEAIGQLLSYNIDDPKSELRVYLFGKPPKEKCVHVVVENLRKLNICPYSIDVDTKFFTITDLSQNTTESIPLKTYA
jgi:hypothetical protein